MSEKFKNEAEKAKIEAMKAIEDAENAKTDTDKVIKKAEKAAHKILKDEHPKHFEVVKSCRTNYTKSVKLSNTQKKNIFLSM